MKTGHNINTDRRRTSRTFALEPDILSDNSDAGLNRKQRRTRNMVAHAKYQRLGHATDKKFANINFTVRQSRNLDRDNHRTAFGSNTLRETDFKYRYQKDRHTLDGYCRKRSKN